MLRLRTLLILCVAGQKACSQHLEQYLRRNKTIPEDLRCRARRYRDLAMPGQEDMACRP